MPQKKQDTTDLSRLLISIVLPLYIVLHKYRHFQLVGFTLASKWAVIGGFEIYHSQL